MTNNAAAERDAFLAALRPLLDDTPAQAALDAYVEELARLDAVARLNPSGDYRAAPLERRDPHARHAWASFALIVDPDDLPKRARKPIAKAPLFRCGTCATISNCVYPYWFRTPDGIWQMAKPPCVAPK